MENNFSTKWNGKFLVWNGYGMEEILQYGIWKNRLPFHSIACPGRRIGFYSVYLVSLQGLPFI